MIGTKKSKVWPGAESYESFHRECEAISASKCSVLNSSSGVQQLNFKQ